MSTELWILIAVGVLFVLGLVYFIVLQERKAKQLDKQIDHSKLREWKDDDW